MTNLLAQISISLVLVTNWTGHNFNGKELGYQTTNHIATVVYEGQTNQFTLKAVASEIAIWRPQQATVIYYNPLVISNYPPRFIITPNTINAN